MRRGSSRQKSLGSYALLAISREPFELCPNFKSLPSIARRELSIDLRWPASKLETQNPPLRSDSKISLVLGEGGVNTHLYGRTAYKIYPMPATRASTESAECNASFIPCALLAMRVGRRGPGRADAGMVTRRAGGGALAVEREDGRARSITVRSVTTLPGVEDPRRLHVVST